MRKLGIVRFRAGAGGFGCADARPICSSCDSDQSGRLLDPCTGNVLAPAALLIEGDKIKQVGSASHDAGMPPLEVLRAVTTKAAEMLGWQDRIGAIEVGKFADLVAVSGDLLADITELERVRLGMKGGKVVRNDLSRGEPRPRAQPS